VDFTDLFLNNLLSPAILFFALGLLAGLIRSDLEVPDSISRYLSLYLMMAIGLKGGAAFAGAGQITAQVWLTIAAAVGFGLLQPVLGFGLLRLTTKLDRPTAAATAAHYGSISIVTFATAVSFLKGHEVAYAGFIVAVVALMEAPAIVSGLFLAHEKTPGRTPTKVLGDLTSNGAVVLLLGAFLIGVVVGPKGLEPLSGFVVTPYQGFLCLFLLDMGLKVAQRAQGLKRFTPALVVFGLYMPVIGAGIGLALARLIGLDAGTGFLLMILCASASYIAVPAAMRLALPQADAAVYLPMSLAITFPFNIGIGLPVYYLMARAVLI